MKMDNFFVGFDSFTRNLPTTDYPRYNILKRYDDSYELQVALPGWDSSSVDVSLHKGVLTIKGDKKEEEEVNLWVHKGISGKSFERSFKLDTDLEVRSAKFENGLLVIVLQYSMNGKPIQIKVQ